MTLDPTQTVASLANAAPHALPVLERHRIDSCCGGTRTLGEACSKAGSSLVALGGPVANLERFPPKRRSA